MNPLIVVGASVRAAAFSALRAGFAPYAIDLFADRDLAAVCPAVKIARYPGEFMAAMAAAPQAPWIYGGGLENYPGLIDQLASIRPLLGNRGHVLRQVRDPARLRDAVQKIGMHFPATGNSRSAAGQWLVKPRRSSGGLEIRFAAASDMARPPRRTYLQPYVKGESASAVFVAAGGRAALLGATTQLLGRDFGMSRLFLYVGSIGPLSLSQTETTVLNELGNVLSRDFGLTGLFNVDFVRNEQGFWPLEVNPRYSASMEIVERVGGTNLIDLHVAACQSGRIPTTTVSSDQRCAGKAVVYASHDTIVPPAFDNVVSDWNHDARFPGIADLPRTGEPLHANQPVVTVFAHGTDTATVETNLRRRVAMVQRLISDP